MKTFNLGKAIGFGLIIWLVMFAVTISLGSLGFYTLLWAQVVSVVIAALVAYGFATMAKAQDISQAFGYGFVWVAIGLLFDLILTYSLLPTLLSMWGYWISYVVILASPWVQYELERSNKFESIKSAH